MICVLIRGSNRFSWAAGCYSELIFISLGFVDLQNSFTHESCLRSIGTEALGEGFNKTMVLFRTWSDAYLAVAVAR